MIGGGVHHARMSATLWASVDRLTRRSRQTITLDDGTTSVAIMPSLWSLAADALEHAKRNQNGAAGSTARERSPIDLDLLIITSLIATTTRRELVESDLTPRKSVPAQIQQLANEIVTNQPARVEWFEYRFATWCDYIVTCLRLGERHPSIVRLRNTACPSCGVRQVNADGDEGEIRVPALFVNFHEGYVRAAECAACGASWFRGDDLHRLAELIAA